MLRRLVGLLPYLLFVLAVAAVTLAPSYRECAGNYNRQDHTSIGGILENIQLVIACEGTFVQQNEGTLVAIAIIFIAFFTLALQRSTARLWKVGERQVAVAETAAETARLSAQAAVLSERAHLLVSIKGSNLEKPLQVARSDEGPEPTVATPVDPPAVDYVLSNYGRTSALLREVKHGLTWEAFDGLRSYQAGVHGPLEMIAPHADSKVITCRFRGDFTARDARSIGTNERALLFFGEAIFLDAFGHLRGVKWQCRCAGGNFDLIGHQEYEPALKEPPPTPD